MKYKLFALCIMLLLLASFSDAKIVFTRKIPETGEKYDLYVVDDDGSHLRKITDTPVHEINAVWSPNGKYIAFEREIPSPKDGKQITNIFITNADGSSERRLTEHPSLDSYPIFLPDSNRLCFSRYEGGQEIRLYAVDLASGAIEIFIDEHVDRPDWSPNGRYIVYQVWNEIFKMPTTRPQKPKFLLPPPKPDPEIIGVNYVYRFNPKWSPDGRAILYTETAYNEQYVAVSSKVFIHDWVLSTQTALPIHKDWRIQRADWMGNENTLILSADEVGIKNGKHGTYNIYRYHIPSDTMTQLTYLTGRNHSPDWIEGALDVSPKKRKITAWGKIKKDTE